MEKNIRMETEREEEETGAEGEESSSSGQVGSGSGLGYVADWSSSDSSSDRSMTATINSKWDDDTESLLDKLSNKANIRQPSRQNAPAICRRGDDDETASKDKSHVSLQQQVKGSETSSAKKLGAGNTSDIPQYASLGLLHDVVQQRSAPFDMKPSVLPQWNGARIEHPMDPRIDLSNVGYSSSADILHRLPDVLPGGDEGPMGMENYLHLLEAVRPFFSAYQPPMPATGSRPLDGNAHPSSSEGFTSFFTTTNSNPETSDSNSNSRASQREHNAHLEGTVNSQSGVGWGEPPSPHLPQNDEQSETSSMKVQARVKRRHLKRNAGVDSEMQSNVQGQRESETANLFDEGRVADLGGNGQDRNLNPPGEDSTRDSSSSSSTSDRQRHPLQHFPVPLPPRVVSETSDSLTRQSQGGFSSTSNTGATTTTSGSGSGGNSGSNNGSSGSGNEGSGSGGNGGSGNEHKPGSNTAVDATNSNSDENLIGRHTTDAVVPSAESSFPANTDNFPLIRSPGLSSKLSSHENKKDETARERKIMEKKRKRMNMRREYEEHVQHQMQSSDSSDSFTEVPLRPGRPVALDEVLSFARSARIIVQATPPHNIVFANAAYTALTGIDTHLIIGQPLSALVSPPPPSQVSSVISKASTSPNPKVGKAQQQPSEAENEGARKNPGTWSAGMAIGHRNEERRTAASTTESTIAYLSWEQDVSIERLVTECGFGQYQTLNAAAKSHRMVGRDVSVVHDSLRTSGSRSSSISCEDRRVPLKTIQCRTSISPVMSAPISTEYGVVTDRDQDIFQPGKDDFLQHNPAKRRKHHHQHDTHREPHRRSSNLITHYVIQLEHVAPDHTEALSSAAEKAESLSSASGGTSARRSETNNDDIVQMDEVVDSDAPGPVAAVG